MRPSEYRNDLGEVHNWSVLSKYLKNEKNITAIFYTDLKGGYFLFWLLWQLQHRHPWPALSRRPSQFSIVDATLVSATIHSSRSDHYS